MTMNTYQCWISGQRAATEETITAPSSFEARKIIARKYRLEVHDAIARRIESGKDQ
jgi:hypothetical protein